MKLLLDMHIAFWAVFERHRLLRGERELLDREDVEIMLSAISIWELGVKLFTRDRRLHGHPLAYCAQ